MFNPTQMKKIFQKIQVVRSPKHRLATFGTSRINYHLVTDVPGLVDRSRLRLGVVMAEKPALITPESLKEQFLGFGDDAREYINTLVNHYGKALRGLEYQFRNEIVSTRIELSPPDSFTQQLSKDFEGSEDYDHVLIRGTDKMWELSVMKFIVEETLSSFATNVQELHERGFFDGDDRLHLRRRREVENLLRIAAKDRSVIPALGAKLKEYGLFERYQDSFFKLIG